MRRVTLVAALVILLLAASASANFVETETGARAMGMGGAFVAVADDATALHWNPAGLASLSGFQVFGMRTSVYSVDGLSEDAVMASYATRLLGRDTGFGLGWMRTGVDEVYNEDTIVAGFGMESPLTGLSGGLAVKRFSIDAPGYEYYNDPNFRPGGDDAYAADVGVLYRRGGWSLGGIVRNIGEPELELIETTENPDPIYGELRLGGAYIFREVMLMSIEWRVPREVPEYFEGSTSFNVGTEVWFYEAFALRAGMNRDRITAGLGLKGSHIQVDVALMSERRIGSLYRLSATFSW